MAHGKKGGSRKPVIKATVLNAPASETALDQFYAAVGRPDNMSGVLEPPYPPKELIRWYDMSSVLPQHIDAIVTNVDSYGHKFVPAIDLESSNAKERIRTAMISEEVQLTDIDDGDFEEPTEGEVTKKLERLTLRAAAELNIANAFFAACCPDYSFIELRTRMRLDERVTGNAYIEVLRDTGGRPARLVLAPAISMRLMPKDAVATEVEEYIRTSEITWKKVKQDRFFRRFAEIDANKKQVKAYFKEYGDPRVISRRTGKIYKDQAEFNADADKKPGDQPATEIIHFTIPNPGSPYGCPQWIGNLPAVMGSRELDEVNLGYFENKTVPPLALLVNGGRLAKGVVPRIEEYIEQQVKGKKNFHKILVIEAEGQKSVAGTAGIIPTLKFEKLKEAQQQDALFQEYDERNWDKVASSFRLPRILVGRDRAINRATAIAAIRFAEEQVFEPIRSRFDEFINRRLLPELGIFFWRFRSNTPVTRDPEMVADIIATLAEEGVITPAEARRFASDVFNEELPVLDEEWTREPLKLLIARLKAKAGVDPEHKEPAEKQPKGKLRQRREQDQKAAESAEADPEDEKN